MSKICLGPCDSQGGIRSRDLGSWFMDVCSSGFPLLGFDLLQHNPSIHLYIAACCALGWEWVISFPQGIRNTKCLCSPDFCGKFHSGHLLFFLSCRYIAIGELICSFWDPRVCIRIRNPTKPRALLFQEMKFVEIWYNSDKELMWATAGQ